MRGSPHAHCLLWVKDAPKIDRDEDNVVCNFVDKYITGVLPTDFPETQHVRILLQSLQKHTLTTVKGRKHAGLDSQATMSAYSDI